MTLLSGVAKADPIGNMLKSALNLPQACDNPLKMIDAMREAESKLRDTDTTRFADVGAFCTLLRANASREKIQCYRKCEQDLASHFQVTKCDQEQRARDAAAHAATEQTVQARQKAESEAAAIRTADLKAGRAKPETLDEAMITYGAKFGTDLASAPKIKPDGRLYALHGTIRIAEEEPEFMASAALSQVDELNVSINRIRAGNFVPDEGSTRYFKVIIPKSMQDYYFSQAKIEGGFDVVGKYVANTKYKTAAGDAKSAPVFEALYLRMW